MAEKKKHNIRVSQSRDISLHFGNFEHHEKISLIGKALSSPIRIKIIEIIRNAPYSLQEISNILDIPLSSTASHIKILEEAGLVVTENQPGIHGTMRVCFCSINSISISSFDANIDSVNKSTSIEMPIGNYFECNVEPTCGLAGEKGLIGAFDSIYSFYSPRRTSAQLIWFTSGSIVYKFPNVANKLLALKELSFSMEICSEAPGFLEDWPSDITISVNDMEIATYTCPGDFGSRRGNLTPSHWANGSTQYGILKTFSVRNTGCYVDGQRNYYNITLRDLHIFDSPSISLKIEVKKNAPHVGGINIFGKKFGDYPQGIIMNITYQ